MSQRIMALYREKGVKPPKGRGIHSYAFHNMATSIKRDNPGMSMNSAYAIAMSKLGRDKSVKKAHRRS